MITIVNIDIGNVGSIVNMLKKIGAPSRLCDAPQDVLDAERLILPGVGAFGAGMHSLHRKGLIDALNEAVLGRRTPVLGVCLGMHLLGNSSEESAGHGLGWLDAQTVRFRSEAAGLRVPHMGWNIARPQPQALLFDRADAEPRFYFAHSYHLRCADPGDVAALTQYGEDFPAAVQKGNIFGVQFHPEKSHRFGRELLQRFVELPRC